MIIGRNLSKKRLILRQRLACSRHQSYVRWISAIHVAIDQPTPSWSSQRSSPPETPTTTLLKNPRRLRHLNRLTPCPPEAARPPTRKLGEKRKSIDVWINSRTRVEKTLAPTLPPALTAGLRKTCPRSRASTVTRKGTTRGTTLSQEKTYQKTSISLGNLRSNDWY